MNVSGSSCIQGSGGLNHDVSWDILGCGTQAQGSPQSRFATGLSVTAPELTPTSPLIILRLGPATKQRSLHQDRRLLLGGSIGSSQGALGAGR